MQTLTYNVPAKSPDSKDRAYLSCLTEKADNDEEIHIELLKLGHILCELCEMTASTNVLSRPNHC